MSKKRLVSVVMIVVIGVMVGYFVLVNKNDDLIKVKLIDAFSGQMISNVDVKIYSDNGIRCIKAPCPTEGQEWTGKSDGNGFVFIPSKIINVETAIMATGYRGGGDLNDDSEKFSNNNWLIELDPDFKNKNFERRIKLIDSQTQKPLPNVSLWIVSNQDCQPIKCSDYRFEGITNDLGNVYYPGSAVSGTSKRWVFVNGYNHQELRTGQANYKIVLEKSI